MRPRPSLRPVAGGARDVETLLQDLLRESDDEATAAPVVVRTSGSTGEPKDVALSTRALRASAAASLRRLGGPGQWLLALPPTSVAGLQVVTRSVLAGTSPVLLEDHLDLPRAVAALMGPRRYLAAVPTQLHRWLADAGHAAALRQLDAVLVGGAAASGSLLARARDAGVRVVTSYGMTETCGGCVYDGLPLDGVAVALGTGGEVRIRGPVLFDGYVARPDLTAEVLRDGELHTPDVGWLDADGRLVVLGRRDDVVVSGGVNVALPAVEERLAEHPAIRDVAVVARPDEEWGSVVVAVVVSDAVPDLGQLRDWVSAVRPRAEAPREVVRADALPMLPSGKVDRQALTRRVADGRHG